MTIQKALGRSVPLFVAAVAVTCMLPVTSCGVKFSRMRDDEAGELYDALVKTCEYDDDFTVVHTGSESGEKVSDGGGDALCESGRRAETGIYSFDFNTGYLIYADDVEQESVSGDEEESYFSSYRTYYVSEGLTSLTRYEYAYTSDGDGESLVKSAASVYDAAYTGYRDMSAITSLGGLYGEDRWKSTRNIRESIFEDGSAKSFEQGKDGKNTIYRITRAGSEGGNGEESEYTTVVEFYVNTEGYVTKYSTETVYWKTCSEAFGGYTETYESLEEYDISYLFDERLRLSESDMEKWDG